MHFDEEQLRDAASSFMTFTYRRENAVAYDSKTLSTYTVHSFEVEFENGGDVNIEHTADKASIWSSATLENEHELFAIYLYGLSTKQDISDFL